MIEFLNQKSVQDMLLLLGGIGIFFIILAVAFRISRIEKVNIKTGQIEADTDDDGPERKPAAKRRKTTRRVV